MTNKKRAKAREISEKTGMSHRAAMNQLKGESETPLLKNLGRTPTQEEVEDALRHGDFPYKYLLEQGFPGEALFEIATACWERFRVHPSIETAACMATLPFFERLFMDNVPPWPKAPAKKALVAATYARPVDVLQMCCFGQHYYPHVFRMLTLETLPNLYVYSALLHNLTLSPHSEAKHYQLIWDRIRGWPRDDLSDRFGPEVIKKCLSYVKETQPRRSEMARAVYEANHFKVKERKIAKDEADVLLATPYIDAVKKQAYEVIEAASQNGKNFCSLGHQLDIPLEARRGVLLVLSRDLLAEGFRTTITQANGGTLGIGW